MGEGSLRHGFAQPGRGFGCPHSTAPAWGASGGSPQFFFFFGGGTLPLRRDRGLTAVCLVLVPLRRSASPGTRQDPQEPDQHPQGHPAPRQVSRGGAPLDGGGAPVPGVRGGGTRSRPHAGAPSPSPSTGELPAPARASQGEGIKRSSALPLKWFCFFFPQKGFIRGRPGIGAEQGGGWD